MVTLKTLVKSTPQQIFDQVANHLYEQAKQSVGDNGCMYRGPNNLKCAAGCLISDEEYKKKFDGPDGVNWEDMIERKYVPKKHGRLIASLQENHDFLIKWDKKSFVKSLNQNLAITAKEFNLEFTPFPPKK